MTTFIQDEESVEDSQPREGYEIQMSAQTFRLTGGDQDQVIDGATYHAEPVLRSTIVTSSTTDRKELEITLPVTHPVVRRYLAGGIPPKTVFVTVRRKQLRSGVTERLWAGHVISIAASGHTAKLLVPSVLTENIQRRLPVITVSRQCPHVLYDAVCGVNKATFTVPGTVVSIVDRVVVVNVPGGYVADYAQFGELLHVTSGESMTIFGNSASDVSDNVTFTLQMRLIDLRIGDTVKISIGCAHDLDACSTKFGNRPNFGGFPELPVGNPFIPNGFGIYQVS